MPLISVIVPVYQVEKTLRRCLDSILAQTFTDYEMILVDDGSTDGGGAICDEYAARDARIRVIHQENQSLSVARNVGVEAAKCELINFIDSDDAVHPRYLELLYGALTRSGAGMSMCSARETEEIGDFLEKEIEKEEPEVFDVCEETLLELFKRPYVCWTAWAKLIPKEILQEFRFEKGRCTQDNAVAVKWLHRAGKIAVLDEQLYFYQINPEGISKRPWNEKRFFDQLWSTSEQIAFFEAEKMDALFRQFSSDYFLRFASAWYRFRKDDPPLAQRIRETAAGNWAKWGRKTVFSPRDRLFVMGMLHPALGDAISRARRCLRRIRSSGRIA